MYPGLPEDLPQERVSRWMGFRPSLPDSLPVIGASRLAANAFHAYGHGHVGLTAGARTGQIAADLASGRRPKIDLAPYSAQRF
jgi:D-amino-acid dehydrogenase